jgi:hypothetical protein
VTEDRQQREKRIALRHPICVPVEYEQDSTAGSGTTCDISSSGVHVAMSHTSTPLSIGDGVKLRFSFFVGSFDVAFPANVVRHTSEGFAVRFDQLGPTHRDVLRQALPGGSERSA